MLTFKRFYLQSSKEHKAPTKNESINNDLQLVCRKAKKLPNDESQCWKDR